MNLTICDKRGKYNKFFVENWKCFKEFSEYYINKNYFVFPLLSTEGVGPGCAEREFECDNGHCILQDYRCDLHQDCSDGSDERDCSGWLHYHLYLKTVFISRSYIFSLIFKEKNVYYSLKIAVIFQDAVPHILRFNNYSMLTFFPSMNKRRVSLA